MADEYHNGRRYEERPEMVDPLIENYNGDYMEETSAEVASPETEYRNEETKNGVEEPVVDDNSLGMGLGTAAIILSLVSLFFLPVLLGAAGIVTGFFAQQKGAKALGWWAIGIGAVSILMTVFFAPFM